MSRRHAAEKREVLPDAKYGYRVVTNFINNLMIDDMDELLTPICKEKGVGLVNASPLHMRILTETGAPECVCRDGTSGASLTVSAQFQVIGRSPDAGIV